MELGIFKQNDPRVKYIKKAIKNNLLLLLDEGLEWVLISGQLGTELWAGEVVFELQSEGHPLELAVITPFLHQEEKWNEQNKDWYNSVLRRADYVNSLTNKGYESPKQFRMKNSFFVQKSDLLLLFYDGEKEGSPKYLYETAKEYQKFHDYDIRLIDFYELQNLADEESFYRGE